MSATLEQFNLVIEAARRRHSQLVEEAMKYEALAHEEIVKEYLELHLKPLRLAIDAVDADRLRLIEAERVLLSIDRALTTVEGDNVTRGEAVKLSIRALVRGHLSEFKVEGRDA